MNSRRVESPEAPWLGRARVEPEVGATEGVGVQSSKHVARVDDVHIDTGPPTFQLADDIGSVHKRSVQHIRRQNFMTERLKVLIKTIERHAGDEQGERKRG